MDRVESRSGELSRWITETPDEELRRGEALRAVACRALSELWRIFAELEAEIAPLLAEPPHRQLSDPAEARAFRPGDRLEIEALSSDTRWPTHLARSLWGFLEEELAGTLRAFPAWIPSHGDWRAEIDRALRQLPEEAREALLAAKRQDETPDRPPGHGLKRWGEGAHRGDGEQGGV